MLVRCGMENNLREWYSIDTNRTEIVDLATWSLEKGITKIASDSLLHERRYNLESLIMRAVIIKDSSFLIVNEDGELDGIFGKILRELSMTLNFSFNIVSEVEEYGSWNLKEKTWSGAVGELYAGRADISISDFSITSARLNAVDFTLPLLLSKKCLYIREPEIFAIKWSSFFQTFSYSIWIAILVILIVGSILLIFLKIQNGTDRNVGHLLSDNFLEIWGIFCQQGLAEMEMTTMVFKWTRALSREGFMTSNLYFSELHESSYYINRIVRPHYVAVISNYNAINEFSLATSNFDMSFAAWLVLFIHKANDYDYCHSPQGNIFHLKFNSEMLVRCGTENILREWYSIDPNRTEIDDVATWNLEKGIINISPNSFYERRYNLQGLIMRAIIIKNSLFIRINKDSKLDGQFDRILEELIGMLNFTFDIVAELDEYGSWNPKEKSWSGAMGELYAGHADICLSDFSMTSARLNIVDFTLPLLTSKNYLYIKKPQLFAINWSSYFLVFSNFVWIAMFGILIFASILLAFFKIRYETDRNIGYLLIDNFLEIWGIFCQQGLVDFPEISSLKIAYLSIFFLAVVLSAAYSAALISFLTSDVTILPFHSLEGFIADGTYQLIVLRGTSDYDLLVNSGDPLGKKLRKFMLKDEELPINIIEGVKKICENPKLAFYSSDEINKIVNFKMPCDMFPIETGRMDNLAMILSKNNPFRDVINFHLQKFINNGMMNHLKETTSKMKSFGMIKHQPVCIINVISLIFFILIGIILSTCILIMEKFFFAHESKKNLMVERMPLKKLDFYVKRKKGIKNITNYYTNRKCSSVKY
ncbi:glutamate receptor ionotropic, kainate glr-3-like isoform X1 [Vespa crabro]|uniref:glutamate receptor ionotropic, kainate glr-3-like isoform X1 n=1 Tax=Vespa crabro TaxID=7445 RepID=UPI001F02CF2C|nr:glutamate receptor ionotropic, kainate glr-3-like isoform X1 [Vespa crabro]